MSRIAEPKRLSDKMVKTLGPRQFRELGIVTNARKVSFTVVLVTQGDRYGSLGRYIHQSTEPQIEFYDRRGMRHGPCGQFVSSYYLDTLTAALSHGVQFERAIPEWSITPANVAEVLAMVAQLAPIAPAPVQP